MPILKKPEYASAFTDFIQRAKSLQAQDLRSKWKWKAGLDGCRAAKRSHKVMMQSAKARLLKVSLAPNTLEPIHTHKARSVLLILEPTRFSYYDMKKVSKREWAKMRDRLPDVHEPSSIGAYTIPPEEPHAMMNLDRDKKYVALRLEIGKV